MARKMPYESYHHFPKIAEESGFAFNIHRPHTRIDWFKIKSIDIENVIRERKFVTVEQHLGDIMNCVLDSEFNVQILDEGVLKMFRLAQLAVEYQQFCRHYLDRSVHLLRDEINALAQELDATKKDLHEKEEELAKMKRKSKNPYRSRYHYGNENIASVLLKTLTNRTDLFASTSNGKDGMLYNKCAYCEKVFLNQIYLKSHLTRRHPNVEVIPQKDETEMDHNHKIEENFRKDNCKENVKLTNEVEELKERLKEMENIISELKAQKSSKVADNSKKNNGITSGDVDKIVSKTIKTKDAEVLTNHEDYLVNKIEELKKTEYDKYNTEINSLRSQIIETLNSFQRTENPDAQLIEQLHATIKQQSNEILALKQDIKNSKLKNDEDEQERKKEMELQKEMWARREENQAKQYETLLKKLNEMNKEAQEARALAEAEKQRGEYLQTLLQHTISQTRDKNVNNTKKVTLSDSENNEKPVRTKHSLPSPNRDTLANLQRKAQELLNGTITSSSDTLCESDNKIEFEVSKTKPKIKQNKTPSQGKVKSSNKLNLKNTDKKKATLISNQASTSELNQKKVNEKSKSHSSIFKEGNATRAPGSPVKLLRAKITEEVNNRMVEFGVDPLKRKLTVGEWRRQRLLLQRQCELKSKKNPSYQKIRNTLVAYLDTSIQKDDLNKKSEKEENNILANKQSKPFSFSSVLSNVKSKALSFVKTKDLNETPKHKNVVSELSLNSKTKWESPISSPEVSPTVASKHRSVVSKQNFEKLQQAMKEKQVIIDEDSDDKSSESNKYYTSAMNENVTENVHSLIKSPVRRPYSANDISTRNQANDNYENGKIGRAKSATNLTEMAGVNLERKIFEKSNLDDDDSSNSAQDPQNKYIAEVNPKIQTKGVLKNASSTSSLNKKKVLFDMEAIQMKSVSASPSQSTAEKFDEKFQLGLVNLDTEEWDISSIENEPLKNDTKIEFKKRPATKVSELTKTIESQLANRKQTEKTTIVAGVDVLGGPSKYATNFGGSNTSLGSSILDESDSPRALKSNAFFEQSLN